VVCVWTIGKTDGGNSDDNQTKLKNFVARAVFFPPPTNGNAAVEISLIVGLGAHF
jgi:hypothetical protein